MLRGVLRVVISMNWHPVYYELLKNPPKSKNYSSLEGDKGIVALYFRGVLKQIVV